MTRDLRNMINERDTNGCEKANSSVYTMAAVAGCLLLCLGIIVYAIIGG